MKKDFCVVVEVEKGKYVVEEFNSILRFHPEGAPPVQSIYVGKSYFIVKKETESIQDLMEEAWDDLSTIIESSIAANQPMDYIHNKFCELGKYEVSGIAPPSKPMYRSGVLRG